ncbi:SDR family oxidoreductase [Paenibacillus methanolicus]|uniref:3-oxoacyl-[acyl-carrier protein] reductase n=1 Tax=Paenibacillus methanolicus TaxID=582686 RepID=A0A5S5CMG0_9BACL|nr:SDR family oxidoreductase [Paenibacillus methanolicus]TYP79568.1 3-oxoacyl-[acyl-carrier protein] reductase [Paenibacillus methanolicus]
MNRLRHKIAIVTGASRPNGIGAAVCRELAGQGADIFFTHYASYDRELGFADADPGYPELLAEELRALRVRASHASVDLSDPAAPERLLNQIIGELGLPDVLVNNATHSIDIDFQALSADNLDLHYQVNLRGTAVLSTVFAKRLDNRKGGRIINLTSGQDRGPMPGNLAYAATKGAVSAFTVSLAAELAYRHITVNAVDPGPTATGWMTPELEAHLLTRFPMGRIGKPEDAAKLIAFLASDDAAWITGQIIHSDGGFR